jgi:hypothetical protein
MVKYYLRSGLSSIRTHTNRKSSRNTPRHELLMQLTTLEIEMARRSTERSASIKRLDAIDQRLADIVEEQATIRQLLGLSDSYESMASTDEEQASTSRRASDGHGVFKY